MHHNISAFLPGDLQKNTLFFSLKMGLKIQWFFMAVVFPHHISTSLQQKHPFSSILMQRCGIYDGKKPTVHPFSKFIKSFIPHHPSPSCWVAGRTSAKDPFCDKWPQAGSGSGSAWQFWSTRWVGFFGPKKPMGFLSSFKKYGGFRYPKMDDWSPMTDPWCWYIC